MCGVYEITHTYLESVAPIPVAPLVYHFLRRVDPRLHLAVGVSTDINITITFNRYKDPRAGMDQSK